MSRNDELDLEFWRTYATFYDSRSPGIDGDTEFFVEEAQKNGGNVLELACGTGRITLPIAEAGIDVTGLDRSQEMLARAREKIDAASPEVRQRVRVLKADMRDFSLGRTFDSIIIPYRAFLHLLELEDQRKCLECVHRHLADDGLFILDIFDPSLNVIAAHGGPLGGALKRMGTGIHPETGRPLIVWETREYDLQNQLLENVFIYEELNETGEVIGKTCHSLRLRFIYPYEMQYLLELCGFEVEALYGDFGRGPFRHGGEQIWLARKK